jgi:hypothetical protein
VANILILTNLEFVREQIQRVLQQNGHRIGLPNKPQQLVITTLEMLESIELQSLVKQWPKLKTLAILGPSQTPSSSVCTADAYLVSDHFSIDSAELLKLVSQQTSVFGKIRKHLSSRPSIGPRPPLEMTKIRQIADIRIDSFVAANDNHALYYGTQNEKCLSVLLSKRDATELAQGHQAYPWSQPTVYWDTTVQTAQPYKFSVLDQKWQLPPKQAWEYFKPLLESLLSKDRQTIEKFYRWFTVSKLHSAPGVGLLVSEYFDCQTYGDQMSNRQHVYLSDALKSCCQSRDPLEYLRYQLGATFIYLINNFLFPEDIRHRCGPWKPWIESILVALLSPQETPRSLEQLVELCESELAKGGSTNLSQALKKSLRSPLEAIDWWLPAAASLAEKHKQGKYYGHLDPKSILFFVDRVEIQMPETDCQQSAQADLYSISLILAALLTNPKDRTRLYLKDWSAMHPLLQDFLTAQLANHSGKAETVDALITDIKGKFLPYGLKAITQDPYWSNSPEAA